MGRIAWTLASRARQIGKIGCCVIWCPLYDIYIDIDIY